GVQRVRKAIEPPAGARDDADILCEVARRLGHDWRYGSPEVIWDELRSLSPLHRGMSWRRLEELGGIQWPCPSEDSLEPPYLHGRLWAAEPAERGRLAPFSVVEHELPVGEPGEESPCRRATSDRLDRYSTGTQRGSHP